MSDLNPKIVKQIEYYFSDVNLSKDKFMQDEIQKDAGWVSLETLIKFNRLKQLTTDFDVIIGAMKSSKAVEVNEADKKIRRSAPLPESLSDFEASLKQNTVYVKGFPKTMTLDELIVYFEQHGKVLQVYMKRYPASKEFKGSVFVTFETNDDMKKLLELPELKHEETVLQKESQEDYFNRKGPEFQRARDTKAKREQEKLEKEKKRAEAEAAYLKEKQKPGSVIHIKGLNAEGTRENIKELFDTHSKVQWIDYNKGEPEAFLRFVEANSAKDAVVKALGDKPALVLKGATLEVRVLEGDDEDAYWKDSLKKMAAGRNAKNAKNNNKRGFSGGRGGGRSKRMRKGGKNDGDDGGSDGGD